MMEGLIQIMAKRVAKLLLSYLGITTLAWETSYRVLSANDSTLTLEKETASTLLETTALFPSTQSHLLRWIKLILRPGVKELELLMGTRRMRRSGFRSIPFWTM